MVVMLLVEERLKLFDETLVFIPVVAVPLKRTPLILVPPEAMVIVLPVMAPVEAVKPAVFPG